MRSIKKPAARNKVRHFKGQSGNIMSIPSCPLKRYKFGQFSTGLLACLLAVVLTGAQSQHAGFMVETLDLSGAGAGLDLKKDMGVNGLDFLSDGRLAVATWGGDKMISPKRGKLYLLSGVLDGGPIKAELLAEKMNYNGGLVVVNDTLYVSNQDGIYLIVPNGTATTPTLLAAIPSGGINSNRLSSVVHKDGYLYSIIQQPYYSKKAWTPLPEPEKILKVNRATGEKTYIAGGLHEPNGGNIGPEGDLFVAEKQGDWVSSSKLVHINLKGLDYSGFNNKKEPFDSPTLPQKPPAIWFEHNVNGNSPNQPILIHKGIYKNQMLIGDHYHCNLMRIFLEKVGGEWQGACFQMLDAKTFSSTPNRMALGPDGSTIYIGGMGSVPDRPSACGGNRTIMKLTPTGKTEFEILAMRSVANGFELEFTHTPGPSALEKGNYSIIRWTHKPQWGYNSGRHVGARMVAIQNVEKGRKENRVTLMVAADDLKHLPFSSLIQSTVFKLFPKGVKSADGKELHTKWAWYTLNKIGPGQDPEENRTHIEEFDFIPREKKKTHLFVNSRSLYLRVAGELRAKIITPDGRVLDEVNTTGTAVLPLGPLPGGVHFLTGTLDGVPFTQKLVAAY